MQVFKLAPGLVVHIGEAIARLERHPRTGKYRLCIDAPPEMKVLAQRQTQDMVDGSGRDRNM